jgi:hypothetical protein
MKRFFRLLLALSLTAILAGPALADLAVDFNGAVNNATNGSWSMGFEFLTNTPVIVGALGFYDHNMSQSHAVGIYDAAKNLLVSTTVLTSDPLSGFFRYHSIAPLLLPAGQTYVIAAVTGKDKYTWDPSGFVTDPSITYLSARFKYSTVLVFPGTADYITRGGFGPNFQFSAPLPGSLILLGSGLVGLFGIRRRLS